MNGLGSSALAALKESGRRLAGEIYDLKRRSRFVKMAEKKASGPSLTDYRNGQRASFRLRSREFLQYRHGRSPDAARDSMGLRLPSLREESARWR